MTIFGVKTRFGHFFEFWIFFEFCTLFRILHIISNCAHYFELSRILKWIFVIRTSIAAYIPNLSTIWPVLRPKQRFLAILGARLHLFLNLFEAPVCTFFRNFWLGVVGSLSSCKHSRHTKFGPYSAISVPKIAIYVAKKEALFAILARLHVFMKLTFAHFFENGNFGLWVLLLNTHTLYLPSFSV